MAHLVRPCLLIEVALFVVVHPGSGSGAEAATAAQDSVTDYPAKDSCVVETSAQWAHASSATRSEDETGEGAMPDNGED